MTYLFLNLLFLLTVIFFIPPKLSRPPKAFWVTLVIVGLLTAVFDPVLVALDIVRYDPTKLLGLSVFGAPIEDFFYALYAVMIVPLIWHKLEQRQERRRA